MEGKRCSEDSLSSILDTLGKTSDNFDDVGRGKGFGCSKVGERVAIKYCARAGS